MQNMADLLGVVFQNLVPLLGLVVLLQLGFCYAIQAIADKQDVPHSWLAWVPLLQIYPVLRAGGASLTSFLGLLAAGILCVIAGAILGPLGTLLALVWGVGLLFYMGQVFWNTAESRHLSGWVGLLAMLPGINFIVYPYIAFHDGWVAPSRLGLLLGLLLIVLPAYPELRKARELAELGGQLGPMAAMADRGDEQGMRRLMLETFQMMKGMEGFEASEGDVDALERAISELGRSASPAAGESDDADDAAAPLVEVPDLVAVSPYFECREGTRERGAAPPSGFERWCERSDPARGAVRHGGYASWHRNARIHETGAYRNGRRDGVWTRWDERAWMQTQAEFREGVQHGFQIDWDDSGSRRREIRFARGEPLGR